MSHSTLHPLRLALLDPHLLSAARDHAPDAWNTLLRQHQLPLYTYVAEMLRDDTAALDVMQETFTATVRHIATLRDDARFSSWLFGIAHQKCVQHWRRTRRTDAIFATTPDDAISGDRPDHDQPDPRTQIMKCERAIMISFMDALPLQNPINFHWLFGFSRMRPAE